MKQFLCVWMCTITYTSYALYQCVAMSSAFSENIDILSNTYIISNFCIFLCTSEVDYAWIILRSIKTIATLRSPDCTD